ncbi:hypothetical protein DL767_006966 [Monosporascus sp. MG133]|nr:hypothetical protein DL767_006966 [Monosporascus sp. MG133]
MTDSADRHLKAETDEREHRSQVNDSNKSTEADNADAEDNEEKGRKIIKSKPAAGVEFQIDTDDDDFAITASTPTGRNKKGLVIEDAVKRAKFEYGHDEKL